MSKANSASPEELEVLRKFGFEPGVAYIRVESSGKVFVTGLDAAHGSAALQRGVTLMPRRPVNGHTVLLEHPDGGGWVDVFPARNDTVYFAWAYLDDQWYPIGSHDGCSWVMLSSVVAL